MIYLMSGTLVICMACWAEGGWGDSMNQLSAVLRWKLMSCNHCQELSQRPDLAFMIGCTKGNNQSDAIVGNNSVRSD